MVEIKHERLHHLKIELDEGKLHLIQHDIEKKLQDEIARSFGVPAALFERTESSITQQPASKEDIERIMRQIQIKLDWRKEMGWRIVEALRQYGAPQENIERVESVLKTAQGLELVSKIQIVELQDLETLYLKFFELYKALSK